MPAVIGPSSVLCAGGRGTEQLWATVRAGISGIKDSHLADRDVEPIPMGVIPEAALLPLPPELLTAGLSSIARRMLQISAPVLRAVSTTAGTPVVVYLAMPQIDSAANSWLGKFLEYLSICAEIPIDIAVSKIFPGGRAAAFAALEAALNAIEQNPAAPVVVGGVDTYLDLRVIGVLDREKRILGNEVSDGFIPGEGAAFLVLRASRKLTPSDAAGRRHGLGCGSSIRNRACPGRRIGRCATEIERYCGHRVADQQHLCGLQRRKLRCQALGSGTTEAH